MFEISKKSDSELRYTRFVCAFNELKNPLFEQNGQTPFPVVKYFLSGNVFI